MTLKVTILIDLTSETNENSTTNVYDSDGDLLCNAETIDDCEASVESVLTEILEGCGYQPNQIDFKWEK